MPPDRPSRQRENAVKARLAPSPTDWLLARYDATDPGEMAELASDEDPNVGGQPIYTLKSLYEPGESMRVTASDYGDTHRWWL